MGNTAEDRIKQLIKDKPYADEVNITRESHINHDLGADSLDHVELIMDIEKEFNIAIKDVDAENINTIGDILDYLKKNHNIE